ncbi:MAG: hypothetical protein NZ811_03045 [Gammaproteobacteria bacterium]|nr:hypothetical protein [Gammaproteobacteria bacterium]
MNIKQLLLTTALITSLSSAAIAEVSISGEAKVNTKGGDHTMEADITTTFNTGDTSVVAQVSLDNNNEVEQLYMQSKVSGVDVKVGRWTLEKNELRREISWAPERVRISTSIGGINLAYWDFTGAGGTRASVSGTIAGTKFLHKWKFWDDVTTVTETQLSGSMGGIDVAFHNKDYGPIGGSDNSVTLKTSVQGIDLAYVDTNSDPGVQADGLLWKHSDYGNNVFTEANGGSVATHLFGNKIEYRGYTIDGVDNKKLILTRNIASGSTFEATLDDNAESLDLELAVKF